LVGVAAGLLERRPLRDDATGGAVVTGGRRRTPNLVVVLFVCIAAAPAGPAWAITPPVIDDSLLPAPSVPSPPVPTTQRRPCATPADAGTGVGIPASDRAALEALWRLSRGERQRIAVIDTGVARHPRLKRIEGAGDFVSSGDGTEDCDGHGTAVAGIIAAAPDPGDTFAGIAPGASLLAIRQSTTKYGPAADPRAIGFGDVATMAQAVRTAADLGATVINISSVACGIGPLDDGALGAALAYAVDVKDAVVVAAAGNSGGAGQCPRQSTSGEMDWRTATVAVSPAWYDDYVLTVGSVDRAGIASPFSTPGPWVDVAAVGEGAVSLSPNGVGLVTVSGTSYAAPIVSGLAALVRSRFPQLTARQVMKRVEAAVQRSPEGWNPVVGNGVVDPLAALQVDQSGAARPTEPNSALASGFPARARHTAFIGTGVCAGIFALAMAMLTSTARLRRHGAAAGGRDVDGR